MRSTGSLPSVIAHEGLATHAFTPYHLIPSRGRAAEPLPIVYAANLPALLSYLLSVVPSIIACTRVLSVRC